MFSNLAGVSSCYVGLRVAMGLESGAFNFLFALHMFMATFVLDSYLHFTCFLRLTCVTFFLNDT